MTASVAIGIDLGGTNIKAAVVDQTGCIVKRKVRPTPSDRSVARIVDEIVQLTHELCNESSINPSEVAGIGIGSPGPLDIKKGIVLQTVNFPEFRNVPLRDLLQKKFDLPVWLDNDGNVAAYGEYWADTKKNGIDSLVMLTLGTGVGAGAIMNGRIYHGHFDNAAELGHMIVVPDGLPCLCGQRGCLEQYASASSVANRVISAIQSGESCSLSKMITTNESIDAEKVSRAAQSNDLLCLRIWDEACQFLAIACINIQHTYNPARIVLGGGMSQAGAFLLDRVNQYIQQHQWKLHDDVPEITLTTLGYDAGMIGAAGLVWME